MDLLTSFLGRGGFLPHGYCFTWAPDLLWAMVGADGAIALAYFSIPLALLSFSRQRRDASLHRMIGLFAAFIFACGITHLMDIWTIWQPDYGAQALSKIVTAAISVVTAIALWRLIPQALAIPSVHQLQAAIGSLEAEAGKRRSAEDNLAETQQSLAVTLASIGAGFIATDREGRVTRMNAVAQQVTGWTQAEALGQIVWTVFRREGRPPELEAMNPIDVMLERQITVDTAHAVLALSRTGAPTAVELQASLTCAADGSVRGMAMVFRDMTRVLRAEVEENRLAAIVESSDDAIIGKTLDGRITSWNGAAQAMFGYSAADAIGQSVQLLIPPERADEEMRILADLARGERVPAFDTQRRAKDGHLIDVSVTISPIRDAMGRIVGASKIARDVTLQRRAEAALRDSEARLRFTLESARIGNWELDLATGVALRSLQHDRCFGHEALLPHWSLDVFSRHLHPDDRAEVIAGLHRAVAQDEDWRTECRVVWPDGSVHWIRIHGIVHRESGLPTRMHGIVTDVTQQRLAEAARVKAERLESENRQILESNRIKSQFLANMSHELRTPLNAVIGFADLLHSGVVPVQSPKHHEFLGHIGTSGRHLLQLINDVLDLSKVESGKFELFPEPVDLPVLLKEVLDVLHTAVQRKHLVVVTELDAGLTDLVLDPARLKQVLYNYLSNAIKFTPERGRVTLRLRAEGATRFRIEVEDNGIGISAQDLPRLFTEFTQLDSGHAKRHQGTGLGLALTRRLVQAQGGSVGVRSTLGQGSVFHIVLARVAGNATTGDAGMPHQRWLVIEDDTPTQTRLVDGLTEIGHQVDAAATGGEATLHAASRSYDAITLDLLLPDQHGLGVLAAIRSQGPSQASPVRGMSMASTGGPSATFAIANVLCKPIRTDEIVGAMSQWRARQPLHATVMVVDDDPLALDLMRSALEALEIRAVCLPGGREALAALDQHRPDALILDLMMPGFDGFETLDALRRQPLWQHLPVYIWTSLLLTDEEYQRLARSAQAILGKGGGNLQAMLDELRRRRPPVALPGLAAS